MGLLPEETDKKRLKQWLEDSYDDAGEIDEFIRAVELLDIFPQVFLDPTQDFSTAPGGDYEEAANPINKFLHSDLLEVSQSCDYKTLRRLGEVLTRLSSRRIGRYANLTYQPFRAYPSSSHSFGYDPSQVWQRVLENSYPCHSSRNEARRAPSRLACSSGIAMSIKPLRDAADAELCHFHENWN